MLAMDTIMLVNLPTDKETYSERNGEEGQAFWSYCHQPEWEQKRERSEWELPGWSWLHWISDHKKQAVECAGGQEGEGADSEYFYEQFF